jgi:transcriptional regulator with XRE-family HTH domain
MLGREEVVARRVEQLRQVRKMTYEGLAQRMTDVGCPIQPSALYKIEKGSPRRRITVDELVALATVFEIALDELAAPLVSPEDEELNLAAERAMAAQLLVKDLADKLFNIRAELERVTSELKSAQRESRRASAAFDRMMNRLPADKQWAVSLRVGDGYDVAAVVHAAPNPPGPPSAATSEALSARLDAKGKGKRNG